MVFSVLTAGAGVGVLGLLGQLAVLGSVLAFSRDNEREADAIGFELMARAGYDQREAARIWETLEKERKAADKSRAFVFFATHPPTDERIESLRALVSKASPAATSGLNTAGSAAKPCSLSQLLRIIVVGGQGREEKGRTRRPNGPSQVGIGCELSPGFVVLRRPAYAVADFELGVKERQTLRADSCRHDAGNEVKR